MVDRIQEEIEHPAVSSSLANKVQQGLDITNPEAHKVYTLEKERGVGFIRGLLITPHAQYRMDLRSVTVSELRLFFTSFQRYLERVSQKSPLEYKMFAKRLQFGEEINWTDPKLKLTVVFYTDRQAIAKIITTYWQGDADPKPVSCGANRRSPINRYATLAEDMTGFQTYVSQNPASADSSPMDSATTTFYNSKHDFGPVGINTQDSSSETYNATPGRGLVDGERYMDNVIRRTNPNRRRMQEDDAGRVTASRRRADLNQQYSGQFIFGPSDIDPEFQGYPSASNSLSPQFPHKQIGDNTPVFTDAHAPGSAKVIPYVTDTEFANRMAAKSSEILQGLDPKVVAKAMSIKPKLTRVDKKNRMWTFTVPSAKEGDYTVKVKGEGNAVYAPKMDLKISCTCKDWVYGGPEHWAKTEGYLYGKPQGTAEAPEVRDSGGVKRVCKHVAAVLQKLEGYSMSTSKKASDSWQNPVNYGQGPEWISEMEDEVLRGGAWWDITKSTGNELRVENTQRVAMFHAKQYDDTLSITGVTDNGKKFQKMLPMKSTIVKDLQRFLLTKGIDLKESQSRRAAADRNLLEGFSTDKKASLRRIASELQSIEREIAALGYTR